MQEGKTLKWMSENLRDIVNSFEGLNRNERYMIYCSVLSVCRACKSASDWRDKLALRKNYDRIVAATRKAENRANLRHKRIETRNSLRGDTIFFLCSKHNKPAEDHKDWQGLMYVDRYWRTKVSGSNYYKVASYIKNHDIATVQEIMGPPVYLTTRPYCKHFFIPMDTDEVLHSSIKKLVDEYGVVREKEYTTDEYYDLREKVYGKLNKLEPCKQFSKKIKPD